MGVVASLNAQTVMKLESLPLPSYALPPPFAVVKFKVMQLSPWRLLRD